MSSYHELTAPLCPHCGVKKIRTRSATKCGDCARNQPIKAPVEFERDELPQDRPSTADLLASRRKRFITKQTASEARRLIPIRVKVDGPFGISHFGDPHVDDDGTNIPQLEHDLGIVNRTEALLAGNVGDYQNNWIGRLARLWAQQSTSAKDAWQLVEWLIGACDWLYLIGGNHDQWTGDGDPLEWITKQAGALYEPNGARLGLELPGGRVIRINARHDYKGHSMWNTAHGVSRAAQTGWRDHILTCGHTHVSGYQVLKDPMTGLISHAIRLASYKQIDRYAIEKGLPDQNIFNNVVTIVDPRFPDDDVRCITTVFSLDEGADFLTWKRRKWAKGGKAA
jgi:hypothetical protein